MGFGEVLMRRGLVRIWWKSEGVGVMMRGLVAGVAGHGGG